MTTWPSALVQRDGRRRPRSARACFAALLSLGLLSMPGGCGGDDDGGTECVACDINQPTGLDKCPDLCPEDSKTVRVCKTPPGGGSAGCCIVDGTQCN